MQYWNEEAIFEVPCATCGKSIEFYKDDTNRKCGSCGNRMVNPRLDFGCAAYCQFAEQCLGTLPEEFVGQQDNLLKDRVAVEVKRLLKSDFKCIAHAIKVARNAEQIGREEGGNIAAAVCAAYLLEAGKAVALNRHPDQAAEHSGQMAKDLAESILGKLGANELIIHDVCSLIDLTVTRQNITDSGFRILADAQFLAFLEEENKHSPLTVATIEAAVDQDLLTDTGRLLARKLLRK